jgi:hypothetical protein
MHALTLTAPWGTLVSIAAQRPELGKHWETRGWAPRNLRGPLRFAIHQAASLKPVGGMTGLDTICGAEPFAAALWPIIGESEAIYNVDRLPLGRIVAVATLAEVGRACLGYDGAVEVPAVRWPDGRIENVPQPELAFGDYRPGRRVWRLESIIALPEPVEATGARSLWMLGPRAEAAVRAQLGAAA